MPSSSVGTDFQAPLRQSDGVIVPPGYVRGQPSTTLLVDHWVCIVAQDNTLVGDTVTIDDLARLPWVASFDQTLVSSAAPLRHVRALGVEPRVEVSVEGFLPVPWLVAGTDRIAFMHEKLVRSVGHQAGIRILPSPLPDNDHLVALYWDASATNDPGHRSFRGVLRRAAATLDS